VTSFSHFYLDIVLTLTINYIAICVRSDWNCPFTALNASHTQIPTANANSIIWRLLLKRHPPSVRMNLDYKRKAIHIIHSLSCLRHWSQLCCGNFGLISRFPWKILSKRSNVHQECGNCSLPSSCHQFLARWLLYFQKKGGSNDEGMGIRYRTGCLVMHFVRLPRIQFTSNSMLAFAFL